MPDTSKNMLVFVHGMGEDTRESVEQEIKTILSEKLGHPIEKHVDIRAIAYNQVFNNWRKRAAEDWSSTVQSLEGRVHFSKMKIWLESASNVNDDHVNRTHWLDVLLYMSNLGVRVQLEVASQLTTLLREFNLGGNLNSRRLVLMGHSLGTSVAHDTLYKMWTGGFAHDRNINLSGLALKFHAFFQLANTSRLLKTFVDPTSIATSVRPVASGMIERMYNVNHKYDPIALVKPFKIKDLSHWLPGEDYPNDRYINIELEGIHHANTHALSHYLSDPRLYCYLFNEIVDGYSFDGCKELIQEHDKGALADEIESLKAAIDSIDFGPIESMSDITRTWKTIEEAQSKVDASWQDLTRTIESLAAGLKD